MYVMNTILVMKVRTDVETYVYRTNNKVYRFYLNRIEYEFEAFFLWKELNIGRNGQHPFLKLYLIYSPAECIV